MSLNIQHQIRSNFKAKCNTLQFESGLRITADLEVRCWNFLPVAGGRLGCSSKQKQREGEVAMLLHISTLRAVTSDQAGSIIRYATRNDKEPQCSRYWHFWGLFSAFPSLFYRLRRFLQTVIFFALRLYMMRKASACNMHRSLT